MNESLNRKEFVRALVDVLNTAITHHRHEDAEVLLRGVRVLRPDFAQLGTYEALIAIRNGQWRQGIQLLNDLDAAAPGWLMGKALMAVCKFAVGDPGWQVHATEVLEADAHGQAAQFMQALMGESLGRSVAAVADMPPWPDFAQGDLHSAQHAGFRLA